MLRFLVGFTLIISTYNVDAYDLGKLISQSESVLRRDTSASVVSMDIKKEDYQRSFDLLVLTDDRTDTGKVLMKMLGPALWRGNITLKVDDKITFYEPRNKRTTIMGSTMLTDNWMGSHFTNDDLLRETDLSKHYNYSEKKNWSSNEATHLLLDLFPKPTSPVSWGRVEYQLRIEPNGNVFPIEIKYFKRKEDESEVRKLTYSDFGTMDGEQVPLTLKMTVAENPNEYTKIQYKKIKFNLDIADSRFSEQSFK